LKRIPSDTWQQIKTAYAGGIRLREIARNMGIPEGTILSRAKREQLGAAAIVVSVGRSIDGYKPLFPIPQTQSAFHRHAQ
jgi:hypothetical protein